MKSKIKKIVATTIVSITATTALGCATTNTKIANKINNGVEDFVSSINNLDYVETNNQNSNLGKIVSALNENNLYTKMTSNTNIENTITRPSERSDNFKLYVLSQSPYITLTSDDNNLNLTMQVSTEKIETTSDDISDKINQLILKRAILMIYVNEIYNGNVNLTEDNKKSINAYVNIIKENASYLKGNRGMVKNQLGMASDLINKENSNNIVNYYIIKSGEALEIRSNKIESSISAIESIISILEQNLTPNSCYYQNNLTSSYENMISKIESNSTNTENEILAKNIAESINMIDNTNPSEINQQTTTYPAIRNTQNQINQTESKTRNITNNKDCIDCDKSQIDTRNSNTTSNNNLQTLESYEESQNQTNTSTQNNTTNRTNQSLNKTQNTTNITKNNDNNIQNNSNNIIKRNRRTRNRQNQSNTDSKIQTNNPTLNIDRLNPTTTPDSNSSRNLSNDNYTPYRLNSINNDNHNRATRVPYRVSSNNID